MNILKYFKSKLSGRRLLFLLMALLLVSGLVLTQAPNSVLGLRRDDPTETDPIGVGDDPPPYQPPAGGFSWSMAKRFGLDSDRDGMIDYHWIEDPNDPDQMIYDPTYIYPSGWKVTFDGCQTAADHASPGNPPEYDYVWSLDNTVVNPLNDRCIWNYMFTDKNPHIVQLSVVNDSDGVVTTFPAQTVQIKDYFIVSIGDSLTSGQGNPDIPLVADPGFLGIGWSLVSPPKWQDERCMRSALAGPAQAALALEAADPHSSVTFISFACSGVTINTLRYDDNDPNKNVGTGMLGPFRGEITDVPYSNTYDRYIPAQMDQLETALVPPSGQDPRQIDALLISAGGNDIHFGQMAEECMNNLDCWNNPLVSPKEDPNDQHGWTLYQLVNRALKRGEFGWPVHNMPDNYDALGAEINALDPKPLNVYITQYPEYTIGNINNGDHCRMLDDIAYPNPYYAIASNEAAVASHFVIKGLNDEILAAVNRFKQAYTMINWQFVDGLSEFVVDTEVPAGTPGLFAGPVGGPGHGYCADDNWIRRADESELIQGPVNLRNKTKGTLHPNFSGQQAIKSRILYYMLPNLAVQSPQEPPTFSFTYSSAGLSSQPGLNGWHIRSCDSNGGCYPKVVAQAVAVSNTAMNGASILVNDESGCTGSVACDIALSADAKQVIYAVEISASGTYRFQFNAQDVSGQVSFSQKEIKVDLEDPILATPIGPFEVEVGDSVVVSASVAVNAEGIPLNDDILVDYDWDLDNDGIFETTDEQPIFSAAELDGPVSKTIQVKVTDRAGRTAAAQATVNVLNASPMIVYDNFDDNFADPSLWSVVQQGGPTASEMNQRLEITLPANSAGAMFSAAYHSACQLRGDFDIRVDYQLLTWPPANGVRVGLNTTHGNIERASFGQTGDFAGGPEVYLTDFAGSVKGITPTSDRSGKLRLARVGDTLTGFYFGNGGWITVGSNSAPTNTGDTPFALGSWSHDPVFADQVVKLAFDNMIIKKGELVCPPLDTTPPTITLTTPAESAVYLLGQTVNADYACQDEAGGSGLASCVGNVPNGSPIDTGSIGAKTFTVNTRDNVGNTASATHTYHVIYNFTGFTSPVDNPSIMNTAKAGQTIPLKWRITDANGNPVTDLTDVSVTAVSLSCPSAPTTDAIEEYATSNSGLQNLGDGYYQWNWRSPTGYANTCKTLKLDLGEGAGFEHLALFQFRK